MSPLYTAPTPSCRTVLTMQSSDGQLPEVVAVGPGLHAHGELRDFGQIDGVTREGGDGMGSERRGRAARAHGSRSCPRRRAGLAWTTICSALDAIMSLEEDSDRYVMPHALHLLLRTTPHERLAAVSVAAPTLRPGLPSTCIRTEHELGGVTRGDPMAPAPRPLSVIFQNSPDVVSVTVDADQELGAEARAEERRLAHPSSRSGPSSGRSASTTSSSSPPGSPCSTCRDRRGRGGGGGQAERPLDPQGPSRPLAHREPAREVDGVRHPRRRASHRYSRRRNPSRAPARRRPSPWSSRSTTTASGDGHRRHRGKALFYYTDKNWRPGALEFPSLLFFVTVCPLWADRPEHARRPGVAVSRQWSGVGMSCRRSGPPWTRTWRTSPVLFNRLRSRSTIASANEELYQARIDAFERDLLLARAPGCVSRQGRSGGTQCRTGRWRPRTSPLARRPLSRVRRDETCVACAAPGGPPRR